MNPFNPGLYLPKPTAKGRRSAARSAVPKAKSFSEIASGLEAPKPRRTGIDTSAAVRGAEAGSGKAVDVRAREIMARQTGGASSQSFVDIVRQGNPGGANQTELRKEQDPTSWEASFVAAKSQLGRLSKEDEGLLKSAVFALGLDDDYAPRKAVDRKLLDGIVAAMKAGDRETVQNFVDNTRFTREIARTSARGPMDTVQRMIAGEPDRSRAELAATAPGTLPYFMSLYDLESYGRRTRDDEQVGDKDRAAFKARMEQVMRIENTPFSASDLRTALRGNAKTIRTKDGAREVPLADALAQIEKATGLPAAKWKFNDKALKYAAKFDGGRFGDLSEREQAAAQGVDYRAERPWQWLQDLGMMGVAAPFIAGARLAQGERRLQDVGDGPILAWGGLVADRLGIGDGSSTKRAAFSYAMDDPSLANADNQTLALRALQDAIGGVASVGSRATSGRSTAASSDALRIKNAAVDFVGELALSFGAAKAIGTGAKNFLAATGRALAAENVLDVPDYAEGVRRSGLYHGTGEFIEGLIKQFNPATLFDPNAGLEEKVVTAISLSLPALGKAADVAASFGDRQNRREAEKIYRDAGAANLRANLETALAKVLRDSQTEAVFGASAEDQAKVMGIALVKAASETTGNDPAKTRAVVEDIIRKARSGELADELNQAASDAARKVSESQGESATAESAEQVADPGVSPMDVMTRLGAGDAVNLTPAQWSILADELLEPLLTGQFEIDVADDGGVQIMPPKVAGQEAGASGQAREATSASEDAQGYRFTRERMSPSDINVQRDLQYKQVGITDASNFVTDEFKSVKKWDEPSAGSLTIWEDSSGKRWAVNGHHRRELAIRLGQPDVAVNVYRESDGVSFNEARALGAIQNMREGKGTAIDAVAILRDLGWTNNELSEAGVSLQTGVARDAASLATLSDEALSLVRNGSVPEAVAAGIGAGGLDPSRQMIALREAARSGLQTRAQAMFLADRVKTAVVGERVDEGSLFGESEEFVTLGEQALIADAAMRQLRKQGRLFDQVAQGKSAGKTKIDGDAQKAEAIMNREAAAVFTDPAVIKALEDGALQYATSGNKADFNAAVKSVADAASDAAKRRIKRFSPKSGAKTQGAQPRAEDSRPEVAEDASAAKAKPKSEAPKKPKARTQIGKNADGQAVYEDERGIRSVAENGFIVSEPVAITPGRGGITATPPEDREARFKTSEELADSDRASAPSPKGQERQYDLGHPMNRDTIKDAFEYYDFIGLRGDDHRYDPGDTATESFDKLDDGEDVGRTLNGTSAVNIASASDKDIEIALAVFEKNYLPIHRYVTLVGGWDRHWGNDAHEAVIPDAKIVAQGRTDGSDSRHINIGDIRSAGSDGTLPADESSLPSTTRATVAGDGFEPSADPSEMGPDYSGASPNVNSGTGDASQSFSEGDRVRQIKDGSVRYGYVTVSDRYGIAVRFDGQPAAETVDEATLEIAPPPASGIQVAPPKEGTPEQVAAEKRLWNTILSPEADALYDAIPSTFNGKVINSDNARELLPEFASGPEGAAQYTKSTSKPSSVYAKDRILREIRARGNRQILLFTAGGVAAGKSSSISKDVLEEADLVFDGTMRYPDQAIDLINEALDNGWEIRVAYVQRPIHLVIKGATARADTTGRWGPATELPSIHIQSQRAFAAVYEHFKDHPYVNLAAIWSTGSPGNPAPAQTLDIDRVREGGDLWYNELEVSREAEASWQEVVESGQYSTELLKRLATPTEGGPDFQKYLVSDARDAGSKRGPRADGKDPRSSSAGPQPKQQSPGQSSVTSDPQEGTPGKPSLTDLLNSFKQENDARLAELEADRARRLKAMRDKRRGAVNITPEDFEYVARQVANYGIELALRGVESAQALMSAMMNRFEELVYEERFRESEADEARAVMQGIMDGEEMQAIFAAIDAQNLSYNEDGDANVQSNERDAPANDPDTLAEGVVEDEPVGADGGSGPAGEGVRGDGRGVPSGRAGTGRSKAGGSGRLDPVGIGVRGSGESGQRPAERGRDYRDAGRDGADGADGLLQPEGVAGKTENLVAAVLALNAANKRGYATPEEQARLALFPGWGFNKRIIDPSHAAGKTPQAIQLREAMTPSQVRAALKATANSHFTDPEIVTAMWSALEAAGLKPGQYLEPSVGSGLFPMLMPDSLWQGSDWTMVDLDETSAAITSHLFPEQRVIHGGFQQVGAQPNSADVVITNVPFAGRAETGIIDPEIRDHLGDLAPLALRSLHNYFLVKSLITAKPGAIVAAITTHYSLDAESFADLRKWMSDQADLVGAVRLPSNAFQRQASTEVVTDVLIFRKRAAGEEAAGMPFVKTVDKKFDTGNPDKPQISVPVNEVFARGRGVVIGDENLTGTMYGSDQYNVTAASATGIGKKVKSALSKQIGHWTTKTEKEFHAPSSETKFIVPPEEQRHHKPGAVFIDEEGRLVRAKRFGTEVLTVSDAHMRVWRDYLDLRSAVEKVFDAQSAPDAALESAQKELKKAYDKFVKKHGLLNKATVTERVKKVGGEIELDEDGDPVMIFSVRFANRPILAADVNLPKVMQLERWSSAEAKVTGLSDVFTKRVISFESEITHVDNVPDAVVASLNRRGFVDMDWIKQITGMSQEQILRDGKEFVVQHTDGKFYEMSEYRSGPVAQRLAEIDEAIAAGATGLDWQREKLVEVQPARVAYEDISFDGQTYWLPPSVLNEFALDHLGARPRMGDQIVVRARRELVVRDFYPSGSAGAEYGGSSYNAADVFEAMVSVGKKTITIKDAEGKTHTDHEQTASLYAHVQKMRAAFQDWVNSKPAHQQAVEDAFNASVNTFAPRIFDGAYLTFPGLNTAEVELRNFRVNAIARAMSQPFTLWWHGVGSGKTYSAAMLAMKLKQSGLRNKPMILAYKPTLEQVINEVQLAYPNANILAATQDSFTKEHRQHFLAQIAHGDWDAIIITQEQFATLMPSEAAINRQFDAQIEELLELGGWKSVGDADNSRNQDLRKLRRQVIDLDKKRDDAIEKARASESPFNFEQLGVDHVIVDEAHMFKGLPVATQNEDISPGSASQRAMGLITKADYLRDIGGGMTFMTGTALVNSGVEVWNWIRYAAPEQAAKMGIHKFDDFVTAFVDLESRPEVGIDGIIKVRTRIRRWRSMAQLAALFSSFGEIVPTKSIPEITLPQLENEQGEVAGKPIVVMVPPTETQRMTLKAIYEGFRKVAEMRKGDAEARKAAGGEYWRLTNRSKMAGHDLRLAGVGSDEAEAGLKTPAMVERVAAVYKEFEAQKGAQLLFVEHGVPGGDVAFNLYDEIKRLLIASGIPANQIKFIHEAKSVTQRIKLAGEVRTGKVRVLLGTRAKLGVGMNVQKHLKAVHHMMIGWNPAMLEQGNGRIERFGNTFNQIRIYYYVTQGMFDQIQAARTQVKLDAFQAFQAGLAGVQFGHADIADFSSEDGAAAMGEAAALASSDDRLLKLISMHEDVASLDRKAAQANTSIAVAKSKLTEAESFIASSGRKVAQLEDDLVTVRSAPGLTEDGVEMEMSAAMQDRLERIKKETGDSKYAMTPRGALFYALQEYWHQHDPVIVFVKKGPKGSDPEIIGKLHVWFSGNLVVKDPQGEAHYLPSVLTGDQRGALSPAAVWANLSSPEKEIQLQIEAFRRESARLESDMPSLRQATQKENPFADQLVKARQDLFWLQFEVGITADRLASGEVDLSDYRPSTMMRFGPVEITNDQFPTGVNVIAVNSYGHLAVDDGQSLVVVQDTDGALLRAVSEIDKSVAPPPFLATEGTSGEVERLQEMYRKLLAGAPPPKIVAPKAAKPKRKTKSGSDRLDATGSFQLIFGPKPIRVSPLTTGTPPKRLDAILFDIDSVMGSRSLYGLSSRGTLGNYLPSSKTRFVRGATDMMAAAHELAHEIDDRYGLFEEYKDLDTTPFDAELDDDAFQATTWEDMEPWHRRAEQFAEFLRLWLINPGETSSRAPSLVALLGDKVPDGIVKALRSFGDDIRAYAGASATEAIAAGVDSNLSEKVVREAAKRLSERANEDYETSRADQIRAQVTDEFAPFVSAVRETNRRAGIEQGASRNPDLPEGLAERENPNVWLRKLNYVDVMMRGMIEQGFRDLDGNIVTPPVAEIFKALDASSMESLQKDFTDMTTLLVAERQLELSQRIEQRTREAVGKYSAAVTHRAQVKARAAEQRAVEASRRWLDGRLSELALQTNRAIAVMNSRGDLTDRQKKIRTKRLLSRAAEAQEKYQAQAADWLRKRVMEKNAQFMTTALRLTERFRARAERRAHVERQQQFAISAGGVRSADQTATDAIAELKADPERYARLQASARAYRSFGDWQLDYLVQTGLLSQDASQKIRDANEYWFSAQRVMDDEDIVSAIRRTAGLSSATSGIKKKKASQRVVANPVDNLLAGLHRTLEAGHRNMTLATWVQLMMPDRKFYGPDQETFADLATELPDGARGTPQTVTVHIEGKERRFHIQDVALFNTIKQLNRAQMSPWIRAILSVLAFPTTALRFGITMFPAFALRNLQRDTGTRLVTSPYRNSLASVLPRSPNPELGSLFETYALGQSRGGPLDSADNWRKVRSAIVRDVLAESGNPASKVRTLVLGGPRLYSRVLEAAERKNRGEVYRAAFEFARKELGRSEEDARLYAAYESRSVMTDFRRAAPVIRILNQFIPFLNAGIQGQAASWTRISQNPQKALTRLFLWSAALIALERAWAVAMDDEDDREQRDPMQRTLFYHFKVADDLYIKVAKPHDLGLLAHALDVTIDRAGGDQAALEGVLSRFLAIMAPATLDDMFGPLKVYAELGMNRDLFRDKPIVSPYEEGLAVDLRKGQQYASPLGQALASTLFGDARQWDHFVKGQFGYMGRFATDTSEVAGGERSLASLASSGAGVTGPAPMYGARDVQFVMRTAKQNGVGKTHLDELQDQYFSASDAVTRDQLAGQIVKEAKRLRKELEAAMAGKSGEARAAAVRSVISAAKKDQPASEPGKFKLPSFKPKGFRLRPTG